jgi:two-component system sensor histidine kinase GlrK
MSALRPRSIFSLILLGFLAVLLPFVLAVVAAVVQVDRFAEQSRLAVVNVRLATEDSRTLAEQAGEMRRALGQFVVRGDRDFLAIYRSRRMEYRAALEHLIELGLPDINSASLRELATDEAELFEKVVGMNALAGVGEGETALDELAAIAVRSEELLDETDGLVAERTAQVTARAELLRRTLLIIAAAAVPATAILIVIFTLVITRPLGALGAAIRRLGAHELEEPIAVQGPRDIEALAGELEWLRRRIRSLEQQRANFLQHISHELKTPLTTIREGSELLTESLGDSGPEEAEIARLLHQSGLHLQRLIEDLLRFARTQELAGDLEFAPAVDLTRLVEESIGSMSVLVDSRSLALDTGLAPVSARCDRGKIRIVVDNLLTNAIKYTPESGRIEISLAAVGTDAVIDIRDSGPGIDPDDRARIFEPFWQGRAPYESSVKGTGLGLSIAKDYVEAHGGSIELVASPQGAHFRVTLPLAGPAPGHGKT